MTRELPGAVPDDLAAVLWELYSHSNASVRQAPSRPIGIANAAANREKTPPRSGPARLPEES